MTWYDPEELKNQADTTQTQPEFDPPTEEDTVEGEPSEDFTNGLARINEVAALVAEVPKG